MASLKFYYVYISVISTKKIALYFGLYVGDSEIDGSTIYSKRRSLEKYSRQI